MNTLTDELRDAIRLYSQLADDLTAATDANGTQDYGRLVDLILQHRVNLARIEQLKSSMFKAMNGQERPGDTAVSESYAPIDGLITTAQAQAVRLLEICAAHAEKIQARRQELQKSLAEAGSGARFLKELQPVRGNYPKFIDSSF